VTTLAAYAPTTFCSRCFCAFKPGESQHASAFPPYRAHANYSTCIARLHEKIGAVCAERDAALVVVRAARVVRVRRWQLGRIDRRLWKLPSGPAARAVWKEWHEAAAALDRAIDVHRLALAAYVRGERR